MMRFAIEIEVENENHVHELVEAIARDGTDPVSLIGFVEGFGEVVLVSGMLHRLDHVSGSPAVPRGFVRSRYSEKLLPHAGSAPAIAQGCTCEVEQLPSGVVGILSHSHKGTCPLESA